MDRSLRGASAELKLRRATAGIPSCCANPPCHPGHESTLSNCSARSINNVLPCCCAEEETSRDPAWPAPAPALALPGLVQRTAQHNSNLLACTSACCAEEEASRDPAWLTCAIMAGAGIAYNLVILAPTKAGECMPPKQTTRCWLQLMCRAQICLPHHSSLWPLTAQPPLQSSTSLTLSARPSSCIYPHPPPGPVPAVIEEPGSISKPLSDRESWLKSWGWKKTIGVALSGERLERASGLLLQGCFKAYLLLP